MSGGPMPCFQWLNNRCPFSDLSCRFAHNKDGMPLCQNWVRSACIGGHGNSCRNRHYYTQYDAALPKPAQPAAPPSSVLTEFSSPLVTRVQKVTEHHKRVEIDLETGKRKSFIETTEQEIIDITGNKENTPVKAPVAQLSKTSKNLKVNLLKKVLAPSQLLSKNNSSEEESTQNSDPGFCIDCKKSFKGERGLKSHLNRSKKCGKTVRNTTDAGSTPAKPNQQTENPGGQKAKSSGPNKKRKSVRLQRMEDPSIPIQSESVIPIQSDSDDDDNGINDDSIIIID